MTAIVILGLIGGLAVVSVFCWAAIDAEAMPPHEPPCSDEQWATLVIAMRTLYRRRRRQARRAERSARRRRTAATA